MPGSLGHCAKPPYGRDTCVSSPTVNLYHTEALQHAREGSGMRKAERGLLPNKNGPSRDSHEHAMTSPKLMTDGRTSDTLMFGLPGPQLAYLSFST